MGNAPEHIKAIENLADIVIVSATQTKALEREWAENGLLPLVKAVKGQEERSWEEFAANMRSFMDGNYAQWQQEHVAYFESLLPQHPIWEKA